VQSGHQRIKKLRKNKSPGIDEYSVVIYEIFWEDIKECCMNSVNFSNEYGNLSDTQYQGVITLIPKPGKDPLFTCNYRHITLLNCDYKNISKVINNRLTKLLHNLIGDEQMGFVKGQFIGNNVRLMFDFIAVMDHQDFPGTLLSVDMCKAFYSLK